MLDFLGLARATYPFSGGTLASLSQLKPPHLGGGLFLSSVIGGREPAILKGIEDSNQALPRSPSKKRTDENCRVSPLICSR